MNEPASHARGAIELPVDSVKSCVTVAATLSLVLALLAGILKPFSLPLVGQLPVAELLLFCIALWAALRAILSRSPPSSLFRLCLFWLIAFALFVTLVGYALADLYWESSFHDILRGWSRIAFLFIDIVAMVCLVGSTKKSIIAYFCGTIASGILCTISIGPLAGDYWKFGYGVPLSTFVLLMASFAGPNCSIVAAYLMAAAHLVMGYRGAAIASILAGSLLLMHKLSPRLRTLSLVPLAVVAAVVATVILYNSELRSGGARRSNIERKAMVQASVEAFLESPFIGHGSWFSKTDVLENVMEIRWLLSEQAGGGFGFARRNSDEELAIHSQLLVSLAEGGILGATFMLLYAVCVLWALIFCVARRNWDLYTPLFVTRLVGAMVAVLFSPFSGHARVDIAVCVAIVLTLRRDYLLHYRSMTSRTASGYPACSCFPRARLLVRDTL